MCLVASLQELVANEAETTPLFDGDVDISGREAHHSSARLRERCHKKTSIMECLMRSLSKHDNPRGHLIVRIESTWIYGMPWHLRDEMDPESASNFLGDSNNQSRFQDRGCSSFQHDCRCQYTMTSERGTFVGSKMGVSFN